jgi:acyl carrier protein
MGHDRTPEAIRAELTRLAIEQLGWAELPDGELSERLDSMQRLALVVAIEDHFQIVFEPEDDAAVRTLDDVIARVHAHLAA